MGIHRFTPPLPSQVEEGDLRLGRRMASEVISLEGSAVVMAAPKREMNIAVCSPAVNVRAVDLFGLLE